MLGDCVGKASGKTPTAYSVDQASSVSGHGPGQNFSIAVGQPYSVCEVEENNVNIRTT